jgi:hypothetical protein
VFLKSFIADRLNRGKKAPSVPHMTNYVFIGMDPAKPLISKLLQDFFICFF